MNPEPNTIPNPSDHFPPDQTVAELAVRFVEEDPAVDGADETKARLAGHLETASLTPDQRNRLAAVLLRALRHGDERVFRAYARLGPAVTSPLFEAAVTCYAASCQHPVCDRARHVVDILHADRDRPTRWPGALTSGERPTVRCVCAARG